MRPNIPALHPQRRQRRLRRLTFPRPRIGDERVSTVAAGHEEDPLPSPDLVQALIARTRLRQNPSRGQPRQSEDQQRREADGVMLVVSVAVTAVFSSVSGSSVVVVWAAVGGGEWGLEIETEAEAVVVAELSGSDEWSF